MLSRRRELEIRHRMINEYSSYDIQVDAAKFLKAHLFTEKLRKHADNLTMQEYTSLRKQALDGDLVGARARLEDILNNKVWRGGVV